MNQFDKLIAATVVREPVSLYYLRPEQFSDPATLGEVRILIRQENLTPSDAQELLLQWNKILNDGGLNKELAPDVRAGWQQVIDYLSFIALSFLNGDQAADLLKRKMLFAFQEGINLQDIIDTCLSITGDDVSGGERRQMMIRAMRNNQEKLGRRVNSIEVFGAGVETTPLIRNWLLDYEAVEANKKKRGTLEHGEYMSKSKNIKLLDEEEREVLGKVIKLFDYLYFEPAVPPILRVESEVSSDEKHVLNIRPASVITGGSEDALTNEVKKLPKSPAAIQRNTPANRLIADVSEPVRVSASAPEVIAPESIVVPAPSFAAPAYSTAAAIIPSAPRALKSAEPSFMFDEQDEREADKFRSLAAGGSSLPEQQLRAFAGEIIKRHNFSFKDESNKRRFVQIFVSRIKDVRSIVDVRESLLKSAEAGGLGLTNDKIEQVIKIIEGAKKQYEQLGKVPVEASPKTPKPSSPIDKLIDADIAQFLLKPTSGEPAKSSSRTEVSTPRVVIEHATIVIPPATPAPEPAKPVAPPVPPTKPVVPPAPIPEKPVTQAVPKPVQPPGGFTPDRVQEWRQEMLKEIARVAPPVVPPKPVAAPLPIPPRVPVPESSPLPPAPSVQSVGGRPQLSDIKAPHTVGPIGELKSLTLTDFRRLGPVLSALDRVLAKIDLIGEASITKRLEAVRAWQASPTYQQYLRLGRESIERGTSVADLTADMDSRGDETLTEAEFNAIADFNAKLRF